jgi:hypothetical protein
MDNIEFNYVIDIKEETPDDQNNIEIVDNQKQENNNDEKIVINYIEQNNDSMKQNNYNVEQINEPLNKNNGLCMFLTIVVSTLVSSISLIAGIIIFYIFSIVGLIYTPNDEVNQLCCNSNLWYYLTTGLVLNFINVIFYKNKDILFGHLEIIIFSLLGMICWGGYELFSISCINNLYDTILYKSSLTYWVFNLFFISFLSAYAVWKYIK